MTVGSLLLKEEKISIPEAHVDKKLKKFFLHHVSIWKLKWRKINLNLKFLIFVIADQKIVWFGFLYANISQTKN